MEGESDRLVGFSRVAVWVLLDCFKRASTTNPVEMGSMLSPYILREMLVSYIYFASSSINTTGAVVSLCVSVPDFLLWPVFGSKLLD